MLSFDRTVTIEKPLVTFPWRLIGFYALTGRSVITFKKELVKETIVEAPEEIREQNPPRRILLVADNYGTHHASPITRTSHRIGPTNSASDSSYSAVFADVNAIKPLWKDLKREISSTIFEDEDHLRDFLIETFLRRSHRVGFVIVHVVGIDLNSCVKPKQVLPAARFGDVRFVAVVVLTVLVAVGRVVVMWILHRVTTDRVELKQLDGILLVFVLVRLRGVVTGLVMSHLFFDRREVADRFPSR